LLEFRSELPGDLVRLRNGLGNSQPGIPGADAKGTKLLT